MLSESHQRGAEELSVSYPQEILLWEHTGKWLGHSAQHKVYPQSITLQSTQEAGAHLHPSLAIGGPVLHTASL